MLSGSMPGFGSILVVSVNGNKRAKCPCLHCIKLPDMGSPHWLLMRSKLLATSEDKLRTKMLINFALACGN